jgi:hypothetical protein
MSVPKAGGPAMTIANQTFPMELVGLLPRGATPVRHRIAVSRYLRGNGVCARTIMRAASGANCAFFRLAHFFNPSAGMHRLFATTWICLLYVCPCDRCTCQGDGAATFNSPAPPETSFGKSDGGDCSFEPGTVLCALPDCYGLSSYLCLSPSDCSEFAKCPAEVGKASVDAAVDASDALPVLDAAETGQIGGDADASFSTDDVDREEAQADASVEADHSSDRSALDGGVTRRDP